MHREPPPLDPQIPDEDDDLSLVRWMLSLTPEERLDALQGFVDSVTMLRDERTTEI